MKYIVKSIKDLNTSFIIKPYDPKEVIFQYENKKLLSEIHSTVYNPKLNKSKGAFLSSWVFYDLDDKNNERYIDFKSYNPKKHYTKFDFEKLEKEINILDFENEIKQIINESNERFINDIEIGVLNVHTEFQTKHLLQTYLKDLEEGITSLNKLRLNKIQKIVKTHYIYSYNLTIDYINTTYHDYIPTKHDYIPIIEDSSLNKILLHNKTNRFLSMESELIGRRFISKSGSKLYWNSERGYKVKLVNFCRLLIIKGYIKEYFEIGNVIAFFEERYNLDTGDQRKPSKFTESEKLIEADFRFLKF